LYPKSSGFIAQTQRSKEHKIKHFGEMLKIEVIPYALPEFNLKESATKLEKILYIGRFEWEKDPEILVKAMSIISLKYPN